MNSTNASYDPLSGTMTRRSYGRRITYLTKRHPWVSTFKLEPAPGHLALVEIFLTEIEAIFGKRIGSRLLFLRIANKQGNLIIHYKQRFVSDMRMNSLVDCVEHTLQQAKAFCPVCGLHNGLSVDHSRELTFCKDHYKFFGDAIFKEDFLLALDKELETSISDSIATVYREAISGNITTTPPKAHGDAEIENEDVSEAATEKQKPKIQFLDKSKVDAFYKNIDRAKSENQRLINLVQSISKAGYDMRQLQTLPTHWPHIVDSFAATFPNFIEVAEILRDYFTLATLKDSGISFPPLLFVGEAGIGKTEAARWLANNLTLPFTVIDMAAAQNGSILSGSEKYWSNSRTGKIFDLLTHETFANPVVMLDELDKAADTKQFDPLAPLYTLLEPNSAAEFVDLSISDFAIDASYINWIATANTLNRIPQPIQSRFTIVNIETPNPEQSTSIMHTIFQQLLTEFNLTRSFSPILSAIVIENLLHQPPRAIKQILKRALASAIRKSRREIYVDDVKNTNDKKLTGIGFLASIN